MNLTPFQKSVYRVVKMIPKGKVLTYKQVALKLGLPNAARAVGNALNKNYNPAIPCHRVIRSDGQIGGFNRGKLNKLRLLKMEAKSSNK